MELDTYEPLSSLHNLAFEEFYSIYAESIRPSERKSRTQIAEIMMKPDYKILLVKRTDMVVGFSVLFIPTTESFCLIEYIGIHNRFRRLGIGEKLFRYSVEVVKSNRGYIPILLEVDSEREPSDDQLSRRERKRFYKKVGCRRIDRLSYLLPLIGHGKPPEMDLVIYLPGDSPPIRKAQAEQWLKTIYRRVYDCDDDDPRIARMLEPVADPLVLTEAINDSEPDL